MIKRQVTERRFKCPSCGYIAVAYKSSARRTKVNHLKKLYCPFCKDEHNFIQLSKYEQKFGKEEVISSLLLQQNVNDYKKEIAVENN